MGKSSDAALGRRALSVVLSSVWTRTYSCLALRRCNWPICTGLMQIRFRQSPLTLGQQLLGNRCSWTGTRSDLGSSHTGNSCCSLLFIFILAWKCQLVENKSLIRNTIWGAVKNKNPQLLNLLWQPTEWSVTSHYHGSKIYRSQQSFFTETAIVKRRKKNMGHHFVLSAIMLRKVIRISFFSFFLTYMYLQNHGLLRSRYFRTMSKWHDNLFSPSTVLVQFIKVTELLTIFFCKCFFPFFTIICQILLLNLSKHLSSIAITKFNLCIPWILKAFTCKAMTLP